GTPSQQSTPDQGNPTTPPPKKKPSPSATPDDRVEVRRSDYVGRPKDEAESDLKDLGLDVEEQEVPNPGDQEKDIVADVSPTGRVEPGSTITLSVFGDPEKASPTDNSGPGNGNGNGNGQGKGDD
ncbi:MAG: PASTA domain-containing protein, partial [Nocardioidaceae bacterium]|nr:PASTA domain-containing protein [Nocardioidaceae bacterium]